MSLLLVLLAPPCAEAQRDARLRTMRAYLKAAAGLGQLNGSVLVAEQGRVLIDTAYGFANMDLGVRNTPDTRFRVASVTKQFTGMAVMMLAMDGKLQISDPITKYLDSIPAAWSGITIHHLLRHTSGISDYEGWFDGYDTQAYSNYMAQEHAAARIASDARQRPLDFPPGSKFFYSNSAYILLGYIIQRASGMSYEEFIRTRILLPLGMNHSSQDHSEEILPDRAEGYRLRPGAFPRAYYNGLTRGDYLHAYYQLMEPPQADAGLVTTARDLYRWDQALYTEKLVTRAALDSIFTPGLGRYGYGWFINQGPDGTTYEHSGGLPGFSCYIMRIPGTHRTIILLGNLERLGRTVRDLASILRGDPVALPQSRHLIASDSAGSAALAGVYRGSSGDSVLVSMEGNVFVANWPGHFRAALFPQSDQEFFAPQLNGTARFVPGDGGTTLSVVDGLGKPVVSGVRAR